MLRNAETVLIRKDGTQFPAEVSVSVNSDSDGSIRYTIAAFDDITERKQAEEALRASEARYRSLVETSPSAIVLSDSQESIVFANQQTADILGYDSVDDLVGMHSREMVAPEDQIRVRDLLYNLPESKTVRNVEAIFIRKDGTRFPAEMSYSVVLDSAGQFQFAIGVIEDITERKQYQEALVDTNRRLSDALEELQSAQQHTIRQERLHALGQVASGIAHDFNNLLTPILGFSDLLLTAPEYLDNKKETTQLLQRINVAAKDAATVVKRLANFYRSREDALSVGPVNLALLFDQAISLTQPKWRAQADSRNVDFRFQTDVEDGMIVQADEGELREALVNLLLSAIDAMPDGGPVTLRARFQGDGVVIEVADTGTGMTEETRQKCLEPFYSTKGAKGTGLGLTTVYGTTQRHGGAINIESELGKGTTFFISLPKREARADDTQMPQRPDVLSALHVLVDDDEPLVREVVVRYLTDDGHTVVEAINGREGLKKFQKGTFDLVLLDSAMPEMNGDQLAVEIKRTAQDIPVIMMTGYARVEESDRSSPANIDVVIGKPVTQDSLRHAFRTARPT